MHKRDAERRLKAFRSNVAYGIEVLLDKALITISKPSDEIEMHDLLQEMGQEIVRQESNKNPGRQSRLWDPKEVLDVLKNNKGTEAVEAIFLSSFEFFGNVSLSSDSFSRMTNLRYVEVLPLRNHHRQFHIPFSVARWNVKFRDSHCALPNELRYLEWPECSFESLPSTFRAEMLVELIMPRSKLKKLWDGVQELVNLNKFDLSNSYRLVEIPDLSRALNIETVNLEGCISLRRLNPSIILSLPKLQFLCLHGCRMIETEMFKRNIHLIDMTNLEHLDLRETNIESLPLNMKEPSMLVILSLDDCRKLVSLPKLPPSLRRLSVRNCTFLTSLNLQNCYSLVNLNAGNCVSLDSDFTQQLVLQHMLHCVWYKCKYFGSIYFRDGVFFFPGGIVTHKFRFRSAKTLVTVPRLSTSDLRGFIFCLVLSKKIIATPGQLFILWHIKKQGEHIVRNGGFCALYVGNLTSDHVLFWYDEVQNNEIESDCYNDFLFQLRMASPFQESHREQLDW